MTRIADLKPTKLHFVMNLVAQAGIDILSARHWRMTVMGTREACACPTPNANDAFFYLTHFQSFQ